jgi:hypothetical protein
MPSAPALQAKINARGYCLSLGPFMPMRRMHIDLGFGFCVYPTIFNSVASKGKGMKTVFIENSQTYRATGRY